MDTSKLANLLQQVADKELSLQQAMQELKYLPYKDLDFAKVDFHRALRQGLAEVIFCPGKTSKQIIEIARHLTENHDLVLATRATPEIARAVVSEFPHAVYHELAQMLVWGTIPTPRLSLPAVAVVTAGTADLPVAYEAALTLEATGLKVIRLNDVGVSGLHRLLAHLELLNSACVNIVIAGMDGVLPTLVAGLVATPVIAVPTSTGYGASFNGLAALLTMLNTCAAGLTVVNIDNGFGAAVAAIRIINSLSQPAQSYAEGNHPVEHCSC